MARVASPLPYLPHLPKIKQAHLTHPDIDQKASKKMIKKTAKRRLRPMRDSNPQP
jgi:hypothetical protein